jgi:hypothetical protein
MSEFEASGLLHDFKWLEFADVSERLVGPIMFQKNGRCKKFGYIKVEAWEEFKCLEMWAHQSGDWSDNVLPEGLAAFLLKAGQWERQYVPKLRLPEYTLQ